MGNPSDVKKRLEKGVVSIETLQTEGEKADVDNTDGHSGQRGGAQKLNIVNEPGLYRLIFAKFFSEFVLTVALNGQEVYY